MRRCLVRLLMCVHALSSTPESLSRAQIVTEGTKCSVTHYYVRRADLLVPASEKIRSEADSLPARLRRSASLCRTPRTQRMSDGRIIGDCDRNAQKIISYCAGQP